jgi:hypothetical protein
MPKREIIINKLLHHRNALRAFCHAPGCKRPNECPKEHEDCFVHLDLSTSIAWEAVDLIEAAVTLSRLQDDFHAADRIIHILTVIRSLHLVVARHGQEFYELAYRLTEVGELIYLLTINGEEK